METELTLRQWHQQDRRECEKNELNDNSSDLGGDVDEEREEETINEEDRNDEELKKLKEMQKKARLDKLDMQIMTFSLTLIQHDLFMRVFNSAMIFFVTVLI